MAVNKMMSDLLSSLLTDSAKLHKQEARSVNDKCKAALELTARSALARLDENNPPAVSSDELVRLINGDDDEDAEDGKDPNEPDQS